MKINRHARTKARKLFAVCKRETGGVDITRVREVLRWVEKNPPRNAVGILTRFQKLVKLECDAHTTRVKTAAPLDQATQDTIRARLATAFGASGEVIFEVQPELLAGIRIQHGSSVWDGTVHGRLDALRKQFN
ncbi:MAG: F0F1 ATP synthase subunit delta [Candidatus Methylacidiphilales bacterium]